MTEAKAITAHAVARSKALKKFEDEVSEAVCDTFYKGFEEYKKKVAQVFNLSDLDHIVADDLVAIRSRADLAILTKDVESEANPIPQASPTAEAAAQPSQLGSMRETVGRVLVEMRAMIDAAVEALMSGGVSTPSSRP